MVTIKYVYDIDLFIDFLQRRKEDSGNFISGFEITYFLDHIGAVSEEEAMKKRYEEISKRIGRDIEEAINIVARNVKDGNEIIVAENVNKFFERLKEYCG